MFAPKLRLHVANNPASTNEVDGSGTCEIPTTFSSAKVTFPKLEVARAMNVLASSLNASPHTSTS